MLDVLCEERLSLLLRWKQAWRDKSDSDGEAARLHLCSFVFLEDRSSSCMFSRELFDQVLFVRWRIVFSRKVAIVYSLTSILGLLGDWDDCFRRHSFFSSFQFKSKNNGIISEPAAVRREHCAFNIDG